MLLKLDQSTIQDLDFYLVLEMTRQNHIPSMLIVCVSNRLIGTAVNVEFLTIQAHGKPLELLFRLFQQYAALIIFDNLAYGDRLIKNSMTSKYPPVVVQ